jgi:AraC family transcriptional regulator
MAALPLPESCSCLTPHFQGGLFAIEDWRCAGTDTPGRHEEWCRDDRVVVTRRGAWELEVEGEARRADPATATFWKGNAPYRVRHPIGGGDHCTLFRLTAAGSQVVRGRARSRPLDGRGYLLHRRALERARQHADPLSIEEPALAFLRLVVDAPEGEVDPSRYVDRARDLIARDFRLPLTVAGIAREVHCSPFHLSRLFRRATGIGLYRAVVRLRLREGLERLLDEPTNLSQIALEVGFASHSHFTDAFRREYGCAPSAARTMKQA